MINAGYMSLDLDTTDETSSSVVSTQMKQHNTAYTQLQMRDAVIMVFLPRLHFQTA